MPGVRFQRRDLRLPDVHRQLDTMASQGRESMDMDPTEPPQRAIAGRRTLREDELRDRRLAPDGLRELQLVTIPHPQENARGRRLLHETDTLRAPLQMERASGRRLERCLLLVASHLHRAEIHHHGPGIRHGPLFHPQHRWRIHLHLPERHETDPANPGGQPIRHLLRIDTVLSHAVAQLPLLPDVGILKEQ